MRLVCMLGFKCDIPVARVLVWLLRAWRRLGACFVPKTEVVQFVCAVVMQWPAQGNPGNPSKFPVQGQAVTHLLLHKETLETRELCNKSNTLFTSSCFCQHVLEQGWCHCEPDRNYWVSAPEVSAFAEILILAQACSLFIPHLENTSFLQKHWSICGALCPQMTLLIWRYAHT